jgi:hypothetical protein
VQKGDVMKPKNFVQKGDVMKPKKYVMKNPVAVKVAQDCYWQTG